MRIQVIISDDKYNEMKKATLGYGHDKDSQMCRFLINEGLKSLNKTKDMYISRTKKIVHTNIENRQSEIDAAFNELSEAGCIIGDSITYNDFETFINYAEKINK